MSLGGKQVWLQAVATEASDWLFFFLETPLPDQTDQTQIPATIYSMTT